QGRVRALEEQPLLRIHHLGLPRRDAEEEWVERVDVREKPAPLAVRLAAATRLRVVILIVRPAVGRHLADTVDAVAQVAPELTQRGRPRIAPGQADRGDVE